MTLPQKVEDYPAALPAEFKAPQGVEFKLDEKDPSFAAARAFALENGLSKDAFGKLVSIYAGAKVGELTSINAAKAAEIQKLGAAGEARMTAVKNWLNGTVGEELGKHFSTFLYTAKQVEVVEKLMERFRTQGAGSYTPSREPGEPAGKLSDAEVAKMTYSQKKDYAARMNGHAAG